MVNTKFEKFAWELCQRIDEEGKLFNLGNALGIRRHIINGIRYNKDKDGLASAANEVLHKWLSRQEDLKESTLKNELSKAFKTIGLIRDFKEVHNEIYPNQPTSTGIPSQGNPGLHDSD